MGHGGRLENLFGASFFDAPAHALKLCKFSWITA